MDKAERLAQIMFEEDEIRYNNNEETIHSFLIGFKALYQIVYTLWSPQIPSLDQDRFVRRQVILLANIEPFRSFLAILHLPLYQFY